MFSGKIFPSILKPASHILSFQAKVDQVLGSCKWYGFHLCAFSKIAQISSLCNFHYIIKGNSFSHAFLVTNDLSAADLVHAKFLLDLKKSTSQGLGVVGCCYLTEYVIFAGLGGLGTLEIMNFLYFLGCILCAKS